MAAGNKKAKKERSVNNGTKAIRKTTDTERVAELTCKKAPVAKGAVFRGKPPFSLC